MDFELSEEHELFRKTVRSWVDREFPKAVARQLESREFEYPFEVWDKMAAAGFHGIGIPEEYGGSGGDSLTQVILARELARSLGGLAWVWGIAFAGNSSVGIHGSREQKHRFLPAMAEGRLRFAMAITEPGGGTDVLGALRTRGEPVDGGWKVSGQKMWTTGAHVADYLLLLARTGDHPTRTEGLTLFLVDARADGLETRQIPKLGMRSIGSCEVFLDDVFVPDELVLGEPGGAWRMLTGTLNSERLLNSAVALGMIDGVLEDTLDYLQQREAFGRKIGQFQILQHYVADIAMMQRQGELLTYYAAWRHSQGRDCSIDAIMAKVQTSEYATRAADLGIQCLGGMGYAMETDAQRYWRDSRIYRLAPISSEMARNAIAESLGLPRSF